MSVGALTVVRCGDGNFGGLFVLEGATARTLAPQWYIDNAGNLVRQRSSSSLKLVLLNRAILLMVPNCQRALFK